MADEENKKSEGEGLNRRTFLKSAGVVVTGSTLAAGTTLAAEPAKAAAEAIPTTLTSFRCPIIEYDMNTSAFSSHIPNPVGSVAWWFDDPYHGEGKSIRIEGAPWGHDQVGGMYRMPAEKVFQECMFVGGRYCDWGVRKSQLVTPLLAKRTGRPVRCVNIRCENYVFGLNQRFMHLKLGFKKNGLITAIDDFTIADGGVRGSSNFGTTTSPSVLFKTPSASGSIHRPRRTRFL